MAVGDFIDFSVYPAHGLGAGRAIFGPDTPLPPSFSRLPMAYNGRAGTVTISEEIVRPQGQTRAFSAQREIEIGECKALDWEFEIVSRASASRPLLEGDHTDLLVCRAPLSRNRQKTAPT